MVKIQECLCFFVGFSDGEKKRRKVTCVFSSHLTMANIKSFWSRSYKFLTWDLVMAKRRKKEATSLFPSI
jgi:hypothetical protein